MLLRLHEWLLCHSQGLIGSQWSSDLAVVDVAVAVVSIAVVGGVVVVVNSAVTTDVTVCWPGGWAGAPKSSHHVHHLVDILFSS